MLKVTASGKTTDLLKNYFKNLSIELFGGPEKAGCLNLCDCQTQLKWLKFGREGGAAFADIHKQR